VFNDSQADPVQLRQWLAATARKDSDAFHSLYNATSPKLFAFALRILRKKELAEETLQDAYIAIWEAAASYHAQLSAPMTWMATIVRNRALDVLRRSHEHEELDSEKFDAAVASALADPQSNPIDKLLLGAEAKALAYCMSLLAGSHRQVLAMAYYHDLSHTEVAQQMALPVGTVKTWIRRSLDRLRSCLAKGDGA
jgi:RNA polymerase sigma factor (sigma-70 family)